MPGAGDYLMEKLGMRKKPAPKPQMPQRAKAVDDLNPVSPNQGKFMENLMKASGRINAKPNEREKYNRNLPR